MPDYKIILQDLVPDKAVLWKSLPSSWSGRSRRVLQQLDGGGQEEVEERRQGERRESKSESGSPSKPDSARTAVRKLQWGSVQNEEGESEEGSQGVWSGLRTDFHCSVPFSCLLFFSMIACKYLVWDKSIHISFLDDSIQISLGIHIVYYTNTGCAKYLTLLQWRAWISAVNLSPYKIDEVWRKREIKNFLC